jgi:predicted dinucleotide-binding enzyme
MTNWQFDMKFAIIGSGKIGAAIARSFARRKIDVAIANTQLHFERTPV